MIGFYDRFAFLLEEKIVRCVRVFEFGGYRSALPMVGVVAVEEEKQDGYEHDPESDDIDDEFLLTYREANVCKCEFGVFAKYNKDLRGNIDAVEEGDGYAARFRNGVHAE